MAQDIVSGLFGLSPYEVNQQYQQDMDKSAMSFAAMDPLKIPAYLAGRAGHGLGGMLAESQGMVRPDVLAAEQRQQALQGLDLSNSQSILAKAQQVQDPKLRMQLMLLGQQKAQEERKAQSDVMRSRLDEARIDRERAVAEKALRGEPEGKYSPDVVKLMSIRDQLPEGHPNRKVLDDAIAKATYIKPEVTAASGGKPKGLSREAGLKWELDNGLITQEMYDQAMSATPGGKLEAKKALQAESFDAVKGKIDLTLGAVDDALKNTGFFTTGITGKVLSNVPGTQAFDLEGTVNTILANLGFQELQAMRNASPTGGALGQVAVRELEMLQSTIASLRMGQSKEKQLQSLNNIQKHLTNWKDAVAKSGIKQEKDGAWEAKTPAEVKALYKSGRLSRDEAKAILKDMGV